MPLCRRRNSTPFFTSSGSFSYSTKTSLFAKRVVMHSSMKPRRAVSQYCSGPISCVSDAASTAGFSLGRYSSKPGELTDEVANSTPTLLPARSSRSLAHALWVSPASTTRFLSSARAVPSTVSRATA